MWLLVDINSVVNFCPLYIIVKRECVVCCSAPDVADDPDYPRQLKKLGENMAHLEKKQKLLDSEQELLDKEESLAQWYSKLKVQEKEVSWS